MKNRSGSFSASARSRCSRYAATTLALCAPYQARAVGARTKDVQRSTVAEDVGPERLPLSATASHPSRRMRSLTARHHGLPGRSANAGCQHPAPKLPAHERNGGAPVRKMSGRASERTVIAALHQRQAGRGIITNRADDLVGPRCGATRGAHLDGVVITPSEAERAEMASQRCVEHLVRGSTGDEPDESGLRAEHLSDHHPGQGPNDGRGQDPGDSIGSLRPRRSRSG